MKSKIITIIITILLISCQKQVQKPITINGTWESIGSGWVLQIQDSMQYTLYDVTDISCLPNRQAALEEIRSSLSLQEDTLALQKGVMTYQFTRVENMPYICKETLSEQKKQDVLYNFEVFAQTVKEHYVFMELNQIDWPVLYQQQKEKILNNPTDPQLYKTIEETLELLGDNHAYLEATDAVYEALENLEALEEEQEETPTETPLVEYGDFQIANRVADAYLTQDMTKDSWLIKWGTMNDNIGYIQLKAMWLYAALDIPQALIDEVGYVDAYVTTFHTMNEGVYIQKEVAGIAKTMDQVMNDLKDTQAMIIDVRFNGGGQDAVSFEILKRFNDQRRQTVKTKLKHHDGFSPELPLFMETTPTAYKNPVYVLTSQQTGSAAEAFAISSMSVPYHKRIGAHTQGALSTALEKTLPNGWTFSISNEIYMDVHGNSYENRGVPVDYKLDYPEDRQTFFRYIANNLTTDKQQVLEAIKAIETQ